MRFQCDHCQTRYAIPDERVVGRVLKIRCKRCRSVVEVIGPPAPGASGHFDIAGQRVEHTTKVENSGEIMAIQQIQGLEHRASGVHFPAQISDLNPQFSLDDDEERPQWWAGIDGRRVGPLTREELRIYARRGSLGMHTYVWHPKMERWGRVSAGGPLRFLRAAVRERDEALRRPRRVTGMESGVFATTGLFDASALAEALREHGFSSVDPRVSSEQAIIPGAATPHAPALALAELAATEHAPSAPKRADSDPAAENPIQHSAALPAAAGAEKEHVLADALHPEGLATIVLEGSDWFVIDERLQAGLWQKLPPDLPGTTALATGVHLLPQRRGIKAVAAVAAVMTLFLGATGLAAWLTRDGLSAILVEPSAPQIRQRLPYLPEASAVEKVRAQLDPQRAQGLRWPGVQAASPVEPQQNLGQELGQVGLKTTAKNLGQLGVRGGQRVLERAATSQGKAKLQPKVTGLVLPELGRAGMGLAASQEAPELSTSTAQDSQAVQAEPRVPGLKPNTAVDPVARGLRSLERKQVDFGQPSVAPTTALGIHVPAPLTPIDVMRVVDQRRPQLEHCYVAALKRDSELSGTVETSIIVGNNGRVSQVRVAANGPGGAVLQKCFAQVMSAWRFEKPDNELEIVMPVLLKSNL